MPIGLSNSVQTLSERHWVSFEVDRRSYAIPVSAVTRVVRAVSLTPVPHGPDLLLGLLDLHGRILPVLNLRRRLGLSDQPLKPSDRLMVVRAGERELAMPVDAVHGVVAVDLSAVTGGEAILEGLQLTATLAGGAQLVLMYEPELLLADGMHLAAELHEESER